MVFAQTVLAGLRHPSSQWESVLRDTVALIAYERPEASPLRHLLSLQQRESVADIVNSAILTIVSGLGPQHRPMVGVGGRGGEGGEGGRL